MVSITDFTNVAKITADMRRILTVIINGFPNETSQSMGNLINSSTEKTTPIDADMVGLMDSDSGNILKKLSWLNIKSTLKSYFDTIYTLLNLGGNPLNGFVNRTSSTIGMSGSTFQITTGSSYDFYSNGVKFTKSTTQSVSIANDNTLHFVYFDTTGTIQVSTTVWDITSDNVPVATVYKTGSVYAVGDERHGYKRNRVWHEWAHDTLGARYQNGLTGTFTNTTLSIAQGIIHDEDLESNTNSTKTVCSVVYRNTGAASITILQNQSTPYKTNAGVIQYDNAGTLTNVANNKYINMWIYCTNDKYYPIYALVGQAEHTNQSGADGEALPVIPISVAEWKLIYRVVYKNVGGTPTYIAATDYRNVSSAPIGSATSNSHASLTDRSLDNQHPATAISVDTTNFGSVLTSSENTVQKVCDKVDDHLHGLSSTIWGYMSGFNQALSTSSNVTFNHITGTLQTAAQPNITSVGTLVSLNVGSASGSPTGRIYATGENMNAGLNLTSSTGTNACNIQATNTAGSIIMGLDSSTGALKGTIYAGLVYHEGNYPLLFGTNNTTRLTIAADGTTTIKQGLNVDGSFVSVGCYSTTVGGTNRDLYIDNTGVIGYVSSALKYKENIRSLDDKSKLIYGLNPVMFDYKNKDQGINKFGLIADEVESLLPDICSYNDIKDDEGNVTCKEIETVSYDDLIPLLLNEIIKLNARVNKLESK